MRMATAEHQKVQPVVELVDIAKRYGSVEVLTQINLTLNSGEVVGLIGDNGAGKSTLVKIISGYIRPSGGKMIVDGTPAVFRSPRDARNDGIETVYQDLAIVDDLSLWRNFFLGRELSRGIAPFRVLRRREMRRICGEQLGEIGLVSLESPDQKASALSGGERQSLAITRATYFESLLLILDEPVAALSVRETRRVLAMVEAAKERGLAVLYIDHNMSHVEPVADRVVVVEHGRLAHEFQRGEASAHELSDILAQSKARRREDEQEGAAADPEGV